MGYDVIFQAIPNDGTIIKLARTDFNWINALSAPHHYCQNTPIRRSLQQRKEGKQFLLEFDRYCKTYNQYISLQLNWGRKWDMLTYLLVSHRRVYALDEVIRFNRNEDLSDLTKDESLIYRAIMGGDWIYDNRVIARAEQSDIPRYLSSQDVKAVATILDEMTFADVFKCYAEYDMNNAHVYKFHPNQSGTRDDIFLAFELLRDVYLKASKIHAGLFHKLI